MFVVTSVFSICMFDFLRICYANQEHEKVILSVMWSLRLASHFVLLNAVFKASITGSSHAVTTCVVLENMMPINHFNSRLSNSLKRRWSGVGNG